MSAPAIERITTEAELEALAPAWQDLWCRAPAATPFHSPAWLLPWWREIGGGDLRVLVARQDGRIVGLLPLYLQHERDGGKLLPLGIAISDYLDGLFEAGSGPEVADAILRCLAGRDDWRACELHPLRAGSPLLAARAPGCSHEILEFEPCQVLEVPPGARDLREVIPSGMRAKFRQAERRATKAGRVRFESATAASVAEILEAFFRLHAARWDSRDAPGVLADPAIQRFHRAAAPHLLKAGLLRLQALRLDEEIIAVVYALSAKDRAYCYLSGFNPDFGAISPGTLTVGHVIRQALGEGARAIDFLRGQERFKARWGAREQPCYGRILRRSA
jgi:CelD/BcsL family acetyltransferase involved in cellulose biosynthesis